MVLLAWSAPRMPRLSSSVGLQPNCVATGCSGEHRSTAPISIGMDQRGDTGGWQFTNFDLTNVYTLGNLLGQPQVWIAVRFFSDYSVTYPEGAYVDDISVRKRTTLDGACCRARPERPAVRH